MSQWQTMPDMQGLIPATVWQDMMNLTDATPSTIWQDMENLLLMSTVNEIKEFDYTTLTGADERINPSFFIDRLTYTGVTDCYFAGLTIRGKYVHPGDQLYCAGSVLKQYNPKIRRGRRARIDKLIAEGTFTLETNFGKLAPDDNLFLSGLKMKLSDTVLENAIYVPDIGRRGLWFRKTDVFLVPPAYFEGVFKPVKRYSRKANNYVENIVAAISAGIIELYSDSPSIIGISNATGGPINWTGDVAYL